MAVQDISILQGALFEMIATIKDPEGAAIDLTGSTFRGMVRESTSAAAAAANFSYELLAQTGDTKGQVRLFILPVDTAAIPIPANTDPGKRTNAKMLYDIEWVVSETVVYRPLYGLATVIPEVTK